MLFLSGKGKFQTFDRWQIEGVEKSNHAAGMGLSESECGVIKSTNNHDIEYRTFTMDNSNNDYSQA